MHEIQGKTLNAANVFLEPIDIENGAMDQIMNVLSLPFAKYFAVMADIHQGYGMPIGGVLATPPDVIIPNAVGVDVGCGMIACRTTLRYEDITKEQLQAIKALVRAKIPMGFNKRACPVDNNDMPDMQRGVISGNRNMYSNAKRQLGTLGGGNHFIEIQEGDDGYVWVMIHSGSRNLGKQVCDHYNSLAKKKNLYNYSKVDPDWDLAFLHKNQGSYHEYILDMNYCIEYAKLSRRKILMDVMICMCQAIPPLSFTWDDEHTYDICHNHAQLENHMGRNYMVHRKGAAGPYQKDTVGIIPGSQGSSSFIVMMKDDATPLALKSTSHGAGRAMSRTDAKKGLDLEAEIAHMDGMGIVHDLGEDDLDEAPGAYKDIDVVMKDQEELVDIVVRLKPICPIKAKRKKGR